MSNIIRLNEIIETKNSRNKNHSYLNFSLSEQNMEEIFGKHFKENSLFNEDYEDPGYILFFEDNQNIYCINYSFSENNYHFYSNRKTINGEIYFYYEPDEHFLREMRAGIETSKKKIRIYERVLEHPKYRLKSLFL